MSHDPTGPSSLDTYHVALLTDARIADLEAATDRTERGVWNDRLETIFGLIAFYRHVELREDEKASARSVARCCGCQENCDCPCHEES